MIIVNTPHNPVGKVYTRHELEAIAALAKEFNLIVMADEVVRFSFWPYFFIWGIYYTSSTIAWFLMIRTMFASQRFPECGIAL
jgi:alanine-alpha-ketoisovalerate/valine-pyruvate aminotransferase